MFFSVTEVYRRIIQPVKTRWNSLAMCVESVVKMKVTLRLLAAEPGHDMHDIIPTEREFAVLTELLVPLLMIKNTSERLSADKPALHIVLCCLMNMLTMSQDQHFEGKSEAFKAFVNSFEKEMLLPHRLPDYGRKVQAYCVGNFLHPRFKGVLVSAKTSRTYQGQELQHTIEFIKDIFKTQVEETPMEVDSPSILNMALDESDWAKMPSFVTEAPAPYLAARQLDPIEIELEAWSKVPAGHHTDIDILDFWRDHEKSFPLLARVARMFFGIPVTSASSERLFSAAGNVISSARTLLATERAEQLIFIHDNYYNVEPTIKKWQIRSEKERGRNRPKPRLTQEQEESAVDDPQPSTSTQSQSLIQTPKTPKTTRSPGVRTKTTPTRIRFMQPISDSESESD